MAVAREESGEEKLLPESMPLLQRLRKKKNSAHRKQAIAVFEFFGWGNSLGEHETI